MFSNKPLSNQDKSQKRLWDRRDVQAGHNLLESFDVFNGIDVEEGHILFNVFDDLDVLYDFNMLEGHKV